MIYGSSSAGCASRDGLNLDLPLEDGAMYRVIILFVCIGVWDELVNGCDEYEMIHYYYYVGTYVISPYRKMDSAEAPPCTRLTAHN
jgi:hypothetical protein